MWKLSLTSYYLLKDRLNDTEDIYRRRAAVSDRGGLPERSEGSAGD